MTHLQNFIWFSYGLHVCDLYRCTVCGRQSAAVAPWSNEGLAPIWTTSVRRRTGYMPRRSRSHSKSGSGSWTRSTLIRLQSLWRTMSTTRDGHRCFICLAWTEGFLSALPSTYPTLWFKEIGVSLKKVYFPLGLWLNSGLRFLLGLSKVLSTVDWR